MTESLLYKLLESSTFDLKLNEKLPKLKLISELLVHHGIPFETWNPKASITLENIELSFSVTCNFRDVYIIAFLLKQYGIDRVYPSRDEESVIAIGTYIFAVPNSGKYAIAEPISIEDILAIDPKTTTLDVVENFYKNHLDEDDIPDFDEQYIEEDSHDTGDQTDWERDYFNAMTDGQLGDYDDFEGGIDEIDTWSRG
jgi:hypothetical protein